MLCEKGNAVDARVFALERKTNLCEYVRALVLWLPLRFSLATISLLSPFLVLGLSIALMGVGAVAWRLVVIATLLAIAGSAIAAIVFAMTAVENMYRERRDRKFHMIEPKRGPALAWIHAKKAAICPTITIEREEDA